MILKNDIEVKCRKCGTINTIKSSDFDEPDRVSEERSMGTEISYYWNYEFECSNCNNHTTVEISAYEYPMGFLNFADKESTGGDVVNEPLIVIDDE